MEKYDLLKFAWPGLKWSDVLLETDHALERVGILACQLGDSGENFVRSLRLPADFNREIIGACKVSQEKLSPVTALSPVKKRILQLVYPQLPAGALEPCVVHGKELKEMGLAGRHIAAALTRVRKAQWEGKVKNKKDALKLLRA